MASVSYTHLKTNTYGDWTKINNSDRFYDLIKGKMTDIEVMVYNNNKNNKLDVIKNDLCYKYVRLSLIHI